jgi:predicted phosphoadenosine phosphosulfate sulfurtransferase
MPKKYLDTDVLTAARERIAFVFDNIEKIYVSFSGGKDSTVLLHLVMEEAIKRNRKVGLFVLDWEVQFNTTIIHIRAMFDLYKDNIIPYWICLPITTTNGCSQIEPEWTAWDEKKKDVWVRQPDPIAIKDKMLLPFYYDGMTFEEFTPLFAKWFSEEKDCACFVGIRAHESLNRFRAISYSHANNYRGIKWSTGVVDNCWNFYPIYDWKTSDIWVYNAKLAKPYNPLYDRMYEAGMTIHQMRIDEPFGETQRKGLWLYQIIEPKTWGKMVLRVSGANQGSLYADEVGNILGNKAVQLPKNHTWKSYCMFLLQTMPKHTAEHYKNKIAVYLKFYRERGYPEDIPDYADKKLEMMGKVPAWRQIAKALLRNDYWCIGLGFGPTKRDAYQKYLALMRKRRNNWKIFDETAKENIQEGQQSEVDS